MLETYIRTYEEEYIDDQSGDSLSIANISLINKRYHIIRTIGYGLNLSFLIEPVCVIES